MTLRIKQNLLLPLLLNLTLAYGASSMLKPDSQYSPDHYQLFTSFTLSFAKEDGGSKDHLDLKSSIIESTMRQDHLADTRPSIKKAYYALDIYFDGHLEKPAVAVKLSNDRVTPVAVQDGRVVDTLNVDLGAKAAAAFKTKNPRKVTLVFLDHQGKVIQSGDVTPP